MIPFEYRTPKNLKEVHATLKEFGTDAKLIAGGTALVIYDEAASGPTELSRQPSLGPRAQCHRAQGRRAAHRRSSDPSRSRRFRLWCAGASPLLAETYHHVATIRVRNRATVGGGLAHADPNQDPPPSLNCAGGNGKAVSPTGSRVIPVDEFFTDYYETVFKPDEFITEVVCAPSRSQRRRGLYEVLTPDRR